ncbi:MULTISPECIES: hypothetical protein [unclassified Rhizobium]|jgi:hypothetical protein|uniref:hypothetical protein n=1 Tax=unclassified Rhizobium TaxID=2613769 RepID=UPI001A99DE85|nr:MULTISPECIES: hypothetical protein [unclassified Rhizobium]MBX5155594.1 hypothetical protein [Rhizobium sp. NZLR8]MBX5167315.1 hypothetical protein [Rhizobium sp. NZLR4b]MBX5171650.1 hypothetical protein [Rhizobium sp. NZLR1b]MBX5185913.1 hypothetical protein [Rhizobium sp. NZLR5]MBX5198400.1 hypothetical protein [Rhizobium sp. NZLR10]
MAMPPVIQRAGDRFATDSFADIISAETFADVRQSARSGLLRLAISFFWIPGGSRSKLDVEATPDYLKRDLGFMDGRNPRHKDGFPL